MTTYYVDGAVGNDSNAGTSEGSGNAWATIGKAASTVAAGDTVYIKASATYSEQVTLSISGALATPIYFIGYTSTTGDEGKITWSGSTYCATTASNFQAHYYFQNIKFTGASSHGVNSVGGDYWKFVNCDFYSNGGNGVELDNNCNFMNCTFYSNTGIGLSADTAVMIAGCIFYSNGGSQIDIDNGFVYRSLFYGGSSSTDLADVANAEVVVGCTFDGENVADGIQSTNTNLMCVDNIVYDCATGVTSGTDWPHVQLFGYNLLHSNTTDYSPSGAWADYDAASGAPAFTDEANDDYTLSETSPAIDAGIVPGGIT